MKSKASFIFPLLYVARYDGGIARASGLKDLRAIVGSQIVGNPTRKSNLNYFVVRYDANGLATAERIHSNGIACAPRDDDAEVCASLLREIGAKAKEDAHV